MRRVIGYFYYKLTAHALSRKLELEVGLRAKLDNLAKCL